MPTQVNNLHIVPAIGVAIHAAQATPIPDEMFIEAADAVADQVAEELLKLGMLFPPQSNILEVQTIAAVRVAKLVLDSQLAGVPQPDDLDALSAAMSTSLCTGLWSEHQLTGPHSTTLPPAPPPVARRGAVDP
jgi:malic enzyme